MSSAVLRRFSAGRHGRARRALRREEGQSSVLFLGLFVILLLMATVMMGATAVNLEARKLLSTADGAATAAAQSAVPTPTGASLSSAHVSAAAQEHLNQVDAGARFADLRLVSASAHDGGSTARVELSASVELPLVSWILPAEVTVAAESHARVSVNR